VLQLYYNWKHCSEAGKEEARRHRRKLDLHYDGRLNNGEYKIRFLTDIIATAVGHPDECIAKQEQSAVKVRLTKSGSHCTCLQLQSDKQQTKCVHISFVYNWLPELTLI